VRNADKEEAIIMDNNRTIKAILFDLGNVIVKVAPDVPAKEYSAYCAMTEQRFMEYITNSDNVKKYQEGKLTSSRFFSRTKRFFRMDIGFHEFYRIWNSMFRPYPEMERIVRNIRKKYPDIRLVLLSDTNEAHYEFLKQECEVLDLLDDWIVSYEVGRQKPHPHMYRAALKAAGTIPKDTFYTDDRQGLIDSARVMGICAFRFTGHEDFQKQLAAYRINV
jgi:putative hydrolase of the HAD superfamily